MKDRVYRTIDDILKDPDLDAILEPLRKSARSVVVDSDIQKFQELETWVRDNGRSPQNSETDLTERKMYHRLKGFVKNKYDKLHAYDTLGLLIHEEDSFYECLGNEVKNDNNKSFKTLDDVLNDDTVLFSDWDNMDITKTKLFQTEKVTRKKRVVNGKIAARQKVAKFDEYKIKFQQVQRELASGQRKLLPFKNYEINLHQYYVLKGQLIYIESFGEEVQRTNKNGSYKEKRVHVIYENGTESMVWYRGLGSSLYGRGGKIVSELESGVIELIAEDQQTGYIYILKSLSDNPQIAKINSLYKIGFTSGNVEKRIANAENEPIYLYAPVKLIEQIKIINLDPRVLETTLHHALADYQLELEIKSPNGKMIRPREWFVIDLSRVEKIINSIIAMIQSEQ